MPSTPNPHPDAQRLADYRAGRLTAPGMLAVSDHLAECPACRAEMAGAAPGSSGGNLPIFLPDAPPTYEEMAALLDGTLNKAQETDVRRRLAASPEASAEFGNLRRFHEESAALLPEIHGPEQAATALGEPASGKVVTFPGVRWRAWPVLVAAAAVVLLMAAWWLTATRHSPGLTTLWANADLTGLPDDLRRSVEQAARTGTLQASARLAALRPQQGVLAGDTSNPVVLQQLAPVGTVVRGDQPTLRWTPRENATGYVVYLANVENSETLLRQEVPGGQTEWKPAKPLLRGMLYEWQVEARHGDEIIDRAPRPPAPETRFQVLDAAHADELARVEEHYPQNPLVLGTAYAWAGLDKEAAGEFEELTRRYPESEVAGKLLRAARERTVVRD